MSAAQISALSSATAEVAYLLRNGGWGGGGGGGGRVGKGG